MGVKAGRNLGLGLLSMYPISIPFPNASESIHFSQMSVSLVLFLVWFTLCIIQDQAELETFTKQRAARARHPSLPSLGAYGKNLRGCEPTIWSGGC